MSSSRLYRYRREPAETWLAALTREPEVVELPGPPTVEAVLMMVDGSILVTSEASNAPIYRLR